MRRTIYPITAAAVRTITAYDFGQPQLSSEFIDPKAKNGKLDIMVYPTTTNTSVSVTTLPSGARVISQDFDGPLTTVGIYAEAGPVYDPVQAPGLSFVLRWALTMSNFDNALFQVDRNLRARGVSLETTDVRKRLIGMRVTARRDMWNAPVNDLCCGVSAPRFHESDIERFRDTWDNLDSEMRWRDPRRYCIEKVESLAFYKTPVGNPRRVLPESNDACNATLLAEHWATYCSPSRLVFAGVNIAHNDLIAAYENSPYVATTLPPHFAKATPPTPMDLNAQRVHYYPGQELHHEENRAKEMGTRPDMHEDTIAALAFQSVGRESSLSDYAAATVLLQTLRAAAGESTTIGATTELVDDENDGMRFFYTPFSSTGLIGVTLRATPSAIAQAALDATSIIKGFVVPKDLAAAKLAAVVHEVTRQQSQRDLCDDLAGSLAREGNVRTDTADIIKAIEGVDTDAVKRVWQVAMSARPCLYATGSTLRLPSLRQLGW